MTHIQPTSLRDDTDGLIEHASSLPEAAQNALRRMDSSRRAISTMQFLPEVGILGMLRDTSGVAPCDVPHERASRLSGSGVANAPPCELDALAAQLLQQRQRVWSRRIGLRPAAVKAWATHADHPVATAVVYAAASAVGASASVITYGWGSDKLYLTCLSAATVVVTVTLVIAHWIVGPTYLKSYLGMVHVTLQLLVVVATEVPLPFRSLEHLPFRNRILFLVRPL